MLGGPVFHGRPYESATLRSFVEQASAVIFMPDDLDLVGLASAEGERMASKWIMLQRFLHD